MIKIITDKRDYIRNADVTRFPIVFEDMIKANVFGKDITMYNDKWMHHLHLKITDKCMCKCDFCIEKGKAGPEDELKYLEYTEKVMKEIYGSGILYSVSLTGGEPLLFDRLPDLLGVLKKYDTPFVTMNTNGVLLNDNKLSIIDGNVDFIDISRHSIRDDENSKLFGCDRVPTTRGIYNIKHNLSKTKVRLQYVITNKMRLEDVTNFIDKFNFVDDFSFRRLMNPSSELHNVKYNSCISESSYSSIMNEVYDKLEFVEQTIQDYYVYETWRYKNKNITFSYSNMDMLIAQETDESNNFYREFILHPDCTFSGSWNKSSKLFCVSK